MKQSIRLTIAIACGVVVTLTVYLILKLVKEPEQPVIEQPEVDEETSTIMDSKSDNIATPVMPVNGSNPVTDNVTIVDNVEKSNNPEHIDKDTTNEEEE